MFDFNQLNKALRNHDAPQVVAIVGNDGLADPTIAEEFISAIRQSSCLVIQIGNTTSEQRRDTLVTECRTLLAKCPDATVKQNFEDHVADAKIVESGYREIFRSIQSSAIKKLSPAERAWGILRRAEGEFAFVKKAIDKELAKLGAEKNPSLDPRQLKIQGEDGGWARPDDAITVHVKNTGDVLVMLAYEYKWFARDTGAIVIPAEVAVDESVSFKSGNFSLAAAQWRRLEIAWDRSRFFGARFRLSDQEFPIKGGGTRVCKLFEVTPATKLELMDRIAQHRLEQVFFQSQKDIEWGTPAPATSGSVPLSKAGYLSSAEQVAVEVLDGNYHLPVDDAAVVIGGLPFKVWLRGYAHYAQLAHDASGQPMYNCLRLSEAELLNGLIASGLSQDQARTFVQLTTFGRGIADLFDAPLVKVSDCSYIFFAPAYQAPTLGVIALSRIASLNRRRDEQGEAANDSVFEDKGKTFENRVVKLFTYKGIPAHGFKYKVDGQEFECDAAALIDDALFIFECKNRSLPMGHVPSLHYFALALDKAQDQVKRIAQQFTDHPEIVRARFGEDAKWNRIVPVVLHAMPWSFGCSNGVYMYDASALSHLLQEGFTSIIAEYNMGGNHRFQRRHRYELRKGEKPTAEELEREMAKPNQFRLNALGWEQMAYPVQIWDDVVFSFPGWSQRTSTVEEQMMALGSSPEEAAKVAKEMHEEVPEKVQKLKDRIQGQEPKVKVGRNDPCPCGSGKKYKRCCLK